MIIDDAFEMLSIFPGSLNYYSVVFSDTHSLMGCGGRLQ
jgi:hypothetical protein